MKSQISLNILSFDKNPVGVDYLLLPPDLSAEQDVPSKELLQLTFNAPAGHIPNITNGLLCLFLG